jgi:hypothetical protein
MMAEGGRLPFCLSFLSASMATSSAAPVAVAPSATWPSTMRRASSWSALGACTASGVSEKATAPTRTWLGSWLRNVRAARWAADRRSGSTSVADIEREWSVTSMIDARSTGTATVFCGLASASTSAASAASASAAGRWRRQAGTVPAATFSAGTAV